MTEKRAFEFVEGSSAKFWEIWREGAQVMTRYGRIGASGQTTVKAEADEAKALKLYERLVGEKTRKGYVEQGAKTAPPVKASAKGKPKKDAGPARVARWTPATRMRLHGCFAPDKADPPDAVMTVDEAWKHLQARYQHLVTVTLEGGAVPTGTGELKKVVSAVAQSFARDRPPEKLDLREEFVRAAMLHMTEGGWGARGDDAWASWSYARALVALWLDRGGLAFVFDVLNHAPLFRLSSRGCAEGNGSFSSHGFSRPPKEREANKFHSHPKALLFDVPPFPVLVGQFHDGREATVRAPVTSREWYRRNAKAVTSPDGGTMVLNNEFFFYVVQPQAYLWALRAHLARLAEPEFVEALQQWKKKAPLRDDAEDAGTAFAFCRDAALVSAAVQRCLEAKAPGPLADLLFAVAAAPEALKLAAKNVVDGGYAFDLVDRLDADARPVLERQLDRAGQWKAALKLL